MKPLIILIVTFFISLLATKLFLGAIDIPLAGRVAMSVMLLITAIGHFTFVHGMTLMIPESIPFKREIVYFTGIDEIAASIGLMIPDLQKLTAWLLIAFFIIILPANINAAKENVDFVKGNTDGRGPEYLWFRIPAQLFFIVWVYYFGIYV
ncbi:MAG TPA: hypothetical protein VK718_09000 [Ferruginibacter sp.]|jgi:uncharacterized membrane protein|nr:hypothetical protein [Ferruginibacter sp.]